MKEMVNARAAPTYASSTTIQSEYWGLYTLPRKKAHARSARKVGARAAARRGARATHQTATTTPSASRKPDHRFTVEAAIGSKAFQMFSSRGRSRLNLKKYAHPSGAA